MTRILYILLCFILACGLLTKPLPTQNSHNKTNVVDNKVIEKVTLTEDQQQQKEKITKLKKEPMWKTIEEETYRVSDKYNIDQDLILAVILTESGFDQYAENGNSKGLMQISTNTTIYQQCTGDPFDVHTNIEMGTKHLAGLIARYDGDIRLALGAYNAGGYAVDQSLEKYGDIPKETVNYLEKLNSYKPLFSLT